MQTLRLANFDRTPAGTTAAGQTSWSAVIDPNVATNLGGTKKFLAVNRAFNDPQTGSTAKKYCLIYNNDGNVLKQIIGVPARNSVAMIKDPTDRISLSNQHTGTLTTVPVASDDPAIGGDFQSVNPTYFTFTPLDFSDYPIVHQTEGDWKYAFENGINTSTKKFELGQDATASCSALSADSVGGATLIHVCNMEASKCHVQIVDASDAPIGSLQLPRSAHIKLRKRATDKVYAAETLSGGGKWINCKVLFNKIRYTN